ncbi:DUF1624 domain-containing protein [Roseibium sp. RKSG952]|uniref:DUF1624 domain-containing protein n=1 Tax=Roseibium sp. RKSG952 TaxID=2529384 RepID=UPI0034CF6280
MYALDAARGLAILAMIIYHFSWDLSWFGFVSWQVAAEFGWRVFAGLIAGSFLFLSGAGIYLAHHEKIRWRGFWRRELVIVAAAAGVSLVTYLAFGETFVRFGILHAIAVSSLIALAFIRAPASLTALAALVFATAPLWASSAVFDGPFWVWTGLGHPGYGSVDYVPVAPWTGVTLAGLCAANLAQCAGLPGRLRLWAPSGRFAATFRFLGQHSLPIYLIHQPILFSLVWAIAALGLAPDRAASAFQESCTVSCLAVQGEAANCAAACACTLDGLKQDGLWEPLTGNPMDPDLRQHMNSRYAQCLANPALFGPEESGK